MKKEARIVNENAFKYKVLLFLKRAQMLPQELKFAFKQWTFKRFVRGLDKRK